MIAKGFVPLAVLNPSRLRWVGEADRGTEGAHGSGRLVAETGWRRGLTSSA
jgi:hypothetical protein